MRPDFSNLKGTELVNAFNQMVDKSIELGLNVKKTKRFKDSTAGILRTEALYKAICEKNGEEYEPPTAPLPEKKKETVSKKKANTTKKKQQTKPVTKKTVNEKTPTKRSVRSEIAETCKVSGGTNRARALDYLYARLGKQAPVAPIMAAVYGSEAEQTSVNAFYTVMRALEIDIGKSKSNFKVKRVKDEKGVSYGLYEKDGE